MGGTIHKERIDILITRVGGGEVWGGGRGQILVRGQTFFNLYPVHGIDHT